MAIIQISRIQHRRGEAKDLPEALAEGELGVATDTGQVFMGAPNFQPIQWRRPSAANPTGTFPYSNIRLLTELDVAYTLNGQVYYHGPLKAFDLAMTSTETGIMNFPVEGPDGSDSYIIDYSITPKGNSIDKPRRVGTLWFMTDWDLVANNASVGISDEYHEMNIGPLYPNGTSVTFTAKFIKANDPVLDPSGTLRGYIQLLYTNTSGLPLRFHMFGKRWSTRALP